MKIPHFFIELHVNQSMFVFFDWWLYFFTEKGAIPEASQVNCLSLGHGEGDGGGVGVRAFGILTYPVKYCASAILDRFSLRPWYYSSRDHSCRSVALPW